MIEHTLRDPVESLDEPLLTPVDSLPEEGPDRLVRPGRLPKRRLRGLEPCMECLLCGVDRLLVSLGPLLTHLAFLLDNFVHLLPSLLIGLHKRAQDLKALHGISVGPFVQTD